MVNESVKNAYVKKLINLSPYFSPFRKTFLPVLLIRMAKSPCRQLLDTTVLTIAMMIMHARMSLW